jgi:hypothetical protein
MPSDRDFRWKGFHVSGVYSGATRIGEALTRQQAIDWKFINWRLPKGQKALPPTGSVVSSSSPRMTGVESGCLIQESSSRTLSRFQPDTVFAHNVVVLTGQFFQFCDSYRTALKKAEVGLVRNLLSVDDFKIDV